MSFHRVCRRNRARLPEYAEGNLSPQASAQVERHLSECLPCRAELRDVTTVIGALRAVSQDPVPNRLVSRVQRAVHQTMNAPKGVGHFWARVAVPVAAATALAALAFALRAPVPHVFRPAGAPAGRRIAAAPAGVASDTAGRGSAQVGPRRGGPAVKAAEPAPAFGFPGASGGGGFLGSPQLGASAEPPKTAAPAAQPKEDAARNAIGRAPTPPAPAPAPVGAAQAQAGAGLAAPPVTQRDQAPQEKVAKAPLAQAPAVSARPKAAALDLAAESKPRVKNEVAAPRIAAGVGVIKKGGRNVIAVQFAPAAYRSAFKVTIGSGVGRRTVRRGPKNTFPVAITAKDLGQGPAAIPITVQTAAGSRSYLLFAPMSLRLGETAPQAPEANYDDASLQKVLSDFTALTGVIVLAEKPLDQKFTGYVPLGTPEESLMQIAVGLDLKLERQGKVGYLLSQSR